ncbi:hypothetical protein GUITHDRAFT_120890 [Guillardia theta CCMP2712]|uniref:Uncharacterized protein n=1 Tax=Guillardia theta (strain CCMP2712) TaxID=905079 RepID=L1I9K5_GUITC|nr:hypothetical protein GUITHDRAFT_120890 [Guillardia theta CCMP2712]EKX32903.1 hypothetical protein GUITHDRAFT_120890 [Guillardia theta CCMP2712]|eukprot:XP_005819883.1 hypothetical protein GUITHDRAFT_120890 [Guillardia theta CCMP2712]
MHDLTDMLDPFVDDREQSLVYLESEQVILTRLIKSRTFGLKHAVFPRCMFVNGQWYDGGVVNNFKGKRAECEGSGGVLPLMIQNNWIVGIENKVRRAKRWGHWFVRNESTGSCGSEAGLRQLLDRMVESVRNGVPELIAGSQSV